MATVDSDIELLNKARMGDISILNHPEIVTIRSSNEYEDTCLHLLARRNKTEVLTHPECGYIKNKYGNSPLHLLAMNSITTPILSHKDVAVSKNNFGQTPLHILALKREIEVLTHPEADKVKDNNGKTPKDILKGVSHVS